MHEILQVHDEQIRFIIEEELHFFEVQRHQLCSYQFIFVAPHLK